MFQLSRSKSCPKTTGNPMKVQCTSLPIIVHAENLLAKIFSLEVLKLIGNFREQHLQGGLMKTNLLRVAFPENLVGNHGTPEELLAFQLVCMKNGAQQHK